MSLHGMALILLAVLTGTASVVLAAVLVRWWDRRPGQGRPRPPQGLDGSLKPMVMLFRNRLLVDATPPARALLDRFSAPEGDWSRLLQWIGPRFPDAIEALSRVNSPSEATAARRQQLIERYVAMLTNPRTTSDEIIVPTGQLFVEALPGRHPLLEDFKLRHRQEDLRRAQTDVRHAELENIRLAARLVAGERNDPQVERRILVDPQLSGPTGWWPCMPGPLGKPGETELDPKEKG